MRHAVFVAAFASLGAPALAASLPPEAPPAPQTAPAQSGPAPELTTLRMPVSVVLAARKYLGRQPYDDVAQIIQAVTGCAAAQTPTNGVLVSHGECPEVTAAMQEDADRISDLERQVKAATDAKAAPQPPAPSAPIPQPPLPIPTPAPAAP